MEPKRSYCDVNCSCKITNQNYLKAATDIVHDNGSVFIMDEMITGFKAYFPGVTSHYNIDADISTWGKSISNGFSFAAMTGKSKIMDLGSDRGVWEEKVFHEFHYSRRRNHRNKSSS